MKIWIYIPCGLFRKDQEKKNTFKLHFKCFCQENTFVPLSLAEVKVSYSKPGVTQFLDKQ